MSNKIKVGDRVRWKQYKGFGIGTVEKIVPTDQKPINVRPHDGYRPSLAAVKEEKCTIISSKKLKK